MIRVDLSIALGIYLVVALGGLVVFWFFSESRHRRRDFPGEEEARWFCSLCFCRYIDSVSDRYSRCPRCRNINER